MKKHLIISIMAAYLLSSAAIIAGGDSGYIVIVNQQNTASSISKGELAKLFLKKTKKWSNRSAVLPVDLNVGNATRGEFSKAVLGKTPRTVKSYWLQQVFAGRNVPPLEKGSNQAVLQYVRGNAGAIGYVSAGTDIGLVKVLKITD